MFYIEYRHPELVEGKAQFNARNNIRTTMKKVDGREA